MNPKPTSKVIGRLVALAGFAAGAVLCYFGFWHIVNGVAPQVARSGLSLTADNMVLNRNWHGNQLYMLVMLYFVIGIVLLSASAFLWRRNARWE